jgi:hypothetical protein
MGNAFVDRSPAPSMSMNPDRPPPGSIVIFPSPCCPVKERSTTTLVHLGRALGPIAMSRLAPLHTESFSTSRGSAQAAFIGVAKRSAAVDTAKEAIASPPSLLVLPSVVRTRSFPRSQDVEIPRPTRAARRCYPAREGATA